MAPVPCVVCKTQRALIIRPKNHQKLCKECFFAVFEDEVHHTITSSNLFYPGERVAIGASGGKDSTVLASVLKTLNARHNYGLDLMLLSIDEGIRGYRDDSLETVKRNAQQYDMALKIVGYDELYGWTMDQVVAAVGKKGNCTYCGVFRRQALDRGARMLGVGHVVTGHNADDVAETVMMNLLRGDLPRLSRATSIVTGTGGGAQAASASGASPPPVSVVKRSKPLKYAYEKEIVLYAHHKRLDYFSTECVYSPEAFRGSARALIKSLERVRPSAILDIVRSGEDLARLVPGERAPAACQCGGEGGSSCISKSGAEAGKHGRQARAADPTIPGPVDDDDAGAGGGGCGAQNAAGGTGEMARMEAQLRADEAAARRGAESEVKLAVRIRRLSTSTTRSSVTTSSQHQQARVVAKQTLGTCERCGYMSSQAVCQACFLLEGLNKNRPQIQI